MAWAFTSPWAIRSKTEDGKTKDSSFGKYHPVKKQGTHDCGLFLISNYNHTL